MHGFYGHKVNKVRRRRKRRKPGKAWKHVIDHNCTSVFELCKIQYIPTKELSTVLMLTYLRRNKRISCSFPDRLTAQ
jgi:hypothetical protein